VCVLWVWFSEDATDGVLEEAAGKDALPELGEEDSVESLDVEKCNFFSCVLISMFVSFLVCLFFFCVFVCLFLSMYVCLFCVIVF